MGGFSAAYCVRFVTLSCQTSEAGGITWVSSTTVLSDASSCHSCAALLSFCSPYTWLIKYPRECLYVLAKACGSQLAITNGSVVTGCKDVSNCTYPEEVIYRCNDGYELPSGAIDTRSCSLQGDGSTVGWDPTSTPIACQRKYLLTQISFMINKCLQL